MSVTRIHTVLLPLSDPPHFFYASFILAREEDVSFRSCDSPREGACSLFSPAAGDLPELSHDHCTSFPRAGMREADVNHQLGTGMFLRTTAGPTWYVRGSAVTLG